MQVDLLNCVRLPRNGAEIWRRICIWLLIILRRLDIKATKFLLPHETVYDIRLIDLPYRLKVESVFHE